MEIKLIFSIRCRRPNRSMLYPRYQGIWPARLSSRPESPHPSTYYLHLTLCFAAINVLSSRLQVLTALPTAMCSMASYSVDCLEALYGRPWLDLHRSVCLLVSISSVWGRSLTERALRLFRHDPYRIARSLFAWLNWSSPTKAPSQIYHRCPKLLIYVFLTRWVHGPSSVYRHLP